MKIARLLLGLSVWLLTAQARFEGTWVLQGGGAEVKPPAPALPSVIRLVAMESGYRMETEFGSTKGSLDLDLTGKDSHPARLSSETTLNARRTGDNEVEVRVRRRDQVVSVITITLTQGGERLTYRTRAGDHHGALAESAGAYRRKP